MRLKISRHYSHSIKKSGRRWVKITGKLDKKEFAKVWNSSNSVSDVAKHFGIEDSYARTIASHLRRKVWIKFMEVKDGQIEVTKKMAFDLIDRFYLRQISLNEAARRAGISKTTLHSIIRRAISRGSTKTDIHTWEKLDKI